MQNTKKVVNIAAIITVVTLFSKVLGFVRELIIAYYYGTSSIVDVYIMAITLPTITLGFLTCIGSAAIPIFTDLLYSNSSKKLVGYTNCVTVISAVVSIVAVAIALCYAQEIVGVVVSGFTVEMKMLTIQYFYISVWNIPITVVLTILISYLQCNECFVSTSLCMLAHSSVQVIFAIIAGYRTEEFLVWGYLYANIFYLCTVVILVKRYKFQLTWYFDKSYTKELIKMLFPIFLSSMLTQINGFVDKYFASSLTEGAISSLNYANTMHTFIIMMLNTGLITVMYPLLSKYIVEGNEEKIKNAMSFSVKYVLIFFLPVTVGCGIVAKPLVSALFERGSFDVKSVENTSIALTMYSFGMVGIGLRDIFNNFFYAIKNTRFTFGMSLLSIILNIFLNMILVQRYRIAGLAISTSLSILLILPLCFCKFQQYFKNVDMHLIERVFLIKIIVSSLIMGACVYGISKLKIGSSVGGLCLEIVGGCIVYFGVCYILRVREIEIGVTYIIDKIRRI